MLKEHPFAVEAFFESSVVLTFALPKEQLSGMIPECLELDTHQDKWAFVAVAMVKTKSLRPKGFPAFLGNDFFLIGYRIFVRYRTNEGKRLRGLFILKSETDKMKMAFFGNIFTHYKYSSIDLSITKKEDLVSISSEKSGLEVVYKPDNENAALPPGSPFADWKEARRFAGPLPFTFSYNPENKKVTIIEGVREHWTPRALEVVKYKAGFLENRNFKDAVLANAFIIQDIPYLWKKGRSEVWKG